MLSNRWFMLAIIFVARMAMGVQFQMVPATAPQLMSSFGLDAGGIGLLVGLYFAPGVVLAFPGGAIGQRFGDKRVVLFGLALMAIGGVVMAAADTTALLYAGRFLSGVGAILMNVLAAKLVADWFAGREIATAMSLVVTSWPVGLAIGAVGLTTISGRWGAATASLATAAVAAACMVIFAVAYRSPAGAAGGGATVELPRGPDLSATIAAGLVWALYNAAVAMILAFAPLMLMAQGASATVAASIISAMLWVVILSVPIGGIVADRTGRTMLVLFGGCVAFAVTLLIGARTDAALATFIAIGLVSGPPAGPIMSLPARVLSPATRAAGMGIFYTIFYAMQWIGPWVAGLVVKQTGSAASALDLGAVFVLAACVMALAYRRIVAAAPVREL